MGVPDQYEEVGGQNSAEEGACAYWGDPEALENAGENGSGPVPSPCVLGLEIVAQREELGSGWVAQAENEVA